MKLFKIIIVVMAIVLLFTSATPFSIMCPKCWKGDHIRSVANRSIKDENTGDKRIVYRCQYGHVIYVDPKSSQ